MYTRHYKRSGVIAIHTPRAHIGLSRRVWRDGQVMERVVTLLRHAHSKEGVSLAPVLTATDRHI